MGKPNYSYEKRQLQIKKQKKRQEKMDRKQNKKIDSPDGSDEPDVTGDGDSESPESAE